MGENLQFNLKYAKEIQENCAIQIKAINSNHRDIFFKFYHYE